MPNKHKKRSFKQRLRQMLEKMSSSSSSCNSSEEEYSSSFSDEESQRRVVRKRKRESLRPSPKPTQKRRRILIESSDTSDEENPESQIDSRKNKEELESILGADPSKGNNEFGPPLDPDIMNRWSNYLNNGFDKDTREAWLNIKFPENGKILDAPKLNPEIEAVLNNIDVKKDNFLASIQNKLGKSLTSIGYTLEESLKRDTPNYANEATRNLVEAAKILCEAHFLLSTHRKHQMYPYIGDTVVRKIANEAKTDTWLFGADFNEKSKAAHDLQKSAANLGFKKKYSNMDKPSTSKQNLNFRRQYPKSKFKRGSERFGRERKFPVRQRYSLERHREYRKDRK